MQNGYLKFRYLFDFKHNMYLFAYRIDMESLYEKCFPDKLYKYSKNNG